MSKQTKRPTISLPQDVYDRGQERAKADSRSFSSYVLKLILDDLGHGQAGRQPATQVEAEQATAA